MHMASIILNLYIQGPQKPLLQLSNHRDYNQCRRLYHCIQGAVASVAGDDAKKEWAESRIMILMDLIPLHPVFPLGTYIVIKSIYTCKNKSM